MSADNGIYVLYTESDKGPEYRVSYATAIGNIYGDFDEELFRYVGDASSILSVFGESVIYHTLNEALDIAEGMEYDIGYLEDGICVISDFKDLGHIFKKE